MAFIFEGIAVNCNPYILWSNSSCGEYAARNINDSHATITIVVSKVGFTKTITIPYLNSVEFSLPSDGIYNVLVTSSDGPNMPVIRSGYIFETCRLYGCLNTLLIGALSSEVASCLDKCGKCKKCKTTKADKVKSLAKLERLSKSNAVWLSILISLLSFKEKFTGANRTDASDAIVAEINERFVLLNKFVLDCCGDAIEKDCTNLSKKVADCGCMS